MADDLSIAHRLSAALLGSVRIQQLDQLQFEDIDTIGSHAYDQSKTDNLLRRFDLEDCRRLDPLTWIPSTMSKAEFESSVIGPDDQRSLVLPNGFRLPCFQGLHRIAAARQWLPPNDLWWNFNIYDSGKLDENCRKRLRECGGSRSRTFCDGEIFRNIRYYQKRGDTKAANEWLARWSATKCREFNRIYQPRGGQNKFKGLSERLDDLLPYPALWTSWHMGTHLPSLNCPEELEAALGEVHSAWKILTCGEAHLLDRDTVKMLEGRCASLSFADRRYITEAFNTGRAFSLVRDQNLRGRLLDATLTYPTIIPSLRVFHENVKYLKAMTDAIKKILPSTKNTIQATLRRYHVPPTGGQFPIQIAEERMIQSDGFGDSFSAAYKQVFLFAMRHFCSLTDTRPLGFREAFMKRCPDRSEIWQRFKSVVRSLGFMLPGTESCNRPSQVELDAIQSLLARLRPPEVYDYQGSLISESVTNLVSTLCSLAPRNRQEVVPVQSCNTTEEWAIERRCGMTDAESFFSDRGYLFLTNIYSSDQPAQESLTSFAVKRSIFRLFFGSNTTHDKAMQDDSEPESQTLVQTQSPLPPVAPIEILVPPVSVLPNPVPQTPEQPSQQITPLLSEGQALVISHQSHEMTWEPSQSQALILSQPNPEVDITMEESSEPSSALVEILDQDRHYCKCKINMNMEDFCNSLPASTYPTVMFFDVETKEALFFRAGGQACDWEQSLNMISHINERWFATVRPHVSGQFVDLVHIPMVEVYETLKRDIIGREGFNVCHGCQVFKTPLYPIESRLEVHLPQFNTEIQQWELANRDLIERGSVYDVDEL